jgi:integrase
LPPNRVPPTVHIKTACNKAKIGALRFHDLRHTAASLMIRGGVPLVDVKDILGQSDIQTTMRYVHSTNETRRRAVDVLEAMMTDRLKSTTIIGLTPNPHQARKMI